MLVKQPYLTRVPVEPLLTPRAASAACPIPTCRKPVGEHTAFMVGPRGAVECYGKKEN